MLRFFAVTGVYSAIFCGTVFAQGNQVSPSPSVGATALPSTPSLRPEIGAQNLPPYEPPGAGTGAQSFGGPGAAAPSMPPMPNQPNGIGPQPMSPRTNDLLDRNNPVGARTQPSVSTTPPASLTSFLDSTTPFVQAFDFLLMLFCGFYCLRSRRWTPNTALTVMATACFVSSVILLAFFLSAAPNNHPLLPLPPNTRNFFYLLGRLLAPFELLLFAMAIVLLARTFAQRGGST